MSAHSDKPIELGNGLLVFERPLDAVRYATRLPAELDARFVGRDRDAPHVHDVREGGRRRPDHMV